MKMKEVPSGGSSVNDQERIAKFQAGSPHHLARKLVETVARTLEPHHLPYYAQDLATVFHSFYKQCRVVSEDEALTKARLKLVEAAKIVLAKTLHLMGMTAPDRM